VDEERIDRGVDDARVGEGRNEDAGDGAEALLHVERGERGADVDEEPEPALDVLQVGDVADDVDRESALRRLQRAGEDEAPRLLAGRADDVARQLLGVRLAAQDAPAGQLLWVEGLPVRVEGLVALDEVLERRRDELLDRVEAEDAQRLAVRVDEPVLRLDSDGVRERVEDVERERRVLRPGERRFDVEGDAEPPGGRACGCASS
jgi:hypothetical protein